MAATTSEQSTQGLAAYRRVFAAPRVKPLLFAALLARMPIGMGAVGLILFIHGETGSFGSAGVVTGAFTIGIGITGPLLARQIDRRGSGPVIIPASLLSAAGLIAVVLLGRAGAGTVPLVIAAALGGCGTPPVGGVLRRHWAELVEPSELQTAYALDAVMVEVIFVSGPLLAGGLAATAGPAIGLLVAAVLGSVGAILFQVLMAVEPGDDPDAERHWLGALRSPTLRVLVLAGIPLGASFGALDVSLPAFGAHHGAAALGGPLTAALAGGSALGGIAFGLRPGTFGRPQRAVVRLGALMTLTYLPLAFATAVPEMFVLAPIAGLCIAPQITVRNNLAQSSVPAGTVVEAFTWLSLAATVGASAGAAVGGPLVEAAGWRSGTILAVAMTAAATLTLFARRELITG
ncbi:MAG TPA: MFS transporter [Solirubrobacterales bacterium]|nr:MFS transporter [Solirubrobacterales bacterium]